MATVTLTDKVIKSLSVDSGVKDFRDRRFRGFGIRVTARGTKSFFIIYAANGRRRRFHLGRYPTGTLARARAKARETLVQVEGGVDPQAEKHDRRHGDTFADLCQLFLELYARPRHSKAWLTEEERIIAKDLVPRLGRIRVTEIRKKEVVLLLDEIAERGPTMANRTRAILSRIFSWAISRDLMEHNPVAGVARPGKERSRERVLTESELRAIWLASTKDHSLAAPMLQLMILTAQRGGEIRAMRWQDIDRSWWTIPRAKSGVSHRVFLSEQALTVLESFDPESGFVFPATRGSTGHLTRPHKAVTRIASAAAVNDWTMHDLRRTAATMMTSMGILPFIVERILGHTDKRITAVYDRSSYDNDKRDAMILWGKLVQGIVTT